MADLTLTPKSREHGFHDLVLRILQCSVLQRFVGHARPGDTKGLPVVTQPNPGHFQTKLGMRADPE